MVLMWLAALCAVPFLGYQLIIYLLTKNENKYGREAHKITWTHEEMVEMAKKKKDENMSDEEYHIKYGAFRHDTYRVTSIPRYMYDLMNIILHWIELYLIHFGTKNLSSKIKIDRPIFIIGDFRSGTSNLERLISHHPSIVAFNMQHVFVWQSPMLWDKIVSWLGELRKKLNGEYGWGHPKSKGLFFPHSSNVLLTRGRPFECENLWEWCKNNLSKNRNYNWDTLDDVNEFDNNTDCDVLDYKFIDNKFEKLLKDSMRMLISYFQNSKKNINLRFINKNPMNGFRIGFLYKMFPDAKFIYIARNPLKTTKSQQLLHYSNCRAYFVDPSYFRKNNMKPKYSKNHLNNPKDSTGYIMHNQYPNDVYGNLWYPRVFPRSQPEHLEMAKYTKQGKESCAFATAISQHERIALKQFSECKMKEGVNVLTVWQEDILEDAYSTFTEVLKFLELESNHDERIKWLEKEDFPGGQANIKRIKSSSNKVKTISFGDQTEQVEKILEKCLERFQKRIPKKRKIDNDNINLGDDTNVSLSEIIQGDVIGNGH